MLSMYRGSTPTFRLAISNDVDMSELGTPTMVISQDLVMISLTDDIVVDAESHYIEAKLPVEQSLRLVPGIKAEIQQAWYSEDGSVISFPAHEFTVLPMLAETIIPDEEEEEEQP